MLVCVECLIGKQNKPTVTVIVYFAHRMVLCSSSSLQGQVQSGGCGSSLHSGIEFGRSRTGEGSSGGRRGGWCEEQATGRNG
jgi:hypothetical protein